jgi:hypothetical protein
VEKSTIGLGMTSPQNLTDWVILRTYAVITAQVTGLITAQIAVLYTQQVVFTLMNLDSLLNGINAFF